MDINKSDSTNIPTNLFQTTTTNNNNNPQTNSTKNSQLFKPLFSTTDNNASLSKPLFGTNPSNSLFPATNNANTLFSTNPTYPDTSQSNNNPFKAFNSTSANPFAASNPFLGSTAPKSRDNTSQDNKSFGDFFKQPNNNNNTKNEEEEDDGYDSNPEQENEWTRNMNPDLKYTAKSTIKSTKDQFEYKGE